MTGSQTKTCQNCKQNFVIEPEDFQFYEKIKVPPPTWCWRCRMQRRMIFRNERALYKRACDLCKKSIIAVHPANSPFPVYCTPCWFSDRWDPLQYGSDYDWDQPFFAQMRALQKRTPRAALEGYQNTNSDYGNFVWFSKDVYLSPSTLQSENVQYSKSIYYSRDIYDSLYTHYSERCYEAVMSQKCNNVRFVAYCHECLNSSFLYDCVDSHDCFMSSNLRHASYVFRNKPVSPEEYKRLMGTVDLTSASSLAKLRREFLELSAHALHRVARTKNVVRATGENITNSKDAHYCFDVDKVENVRYFVQGVDVKDSMDLYGSGNGAELLYEGVNVGYKDKGTYFSANTYDGCVDAYYADYCRHVQYVFGCVGLRNKQYCILNKQYSKEECETVTTKIREQMRTMPYTDANGRTYAYGEFFPPELSPFAYNETVAHEFFPMTREEAEERGFGWKEPDRKGHVASVTIDKLPDTIADVTDDILNEAIACDHDGQCLEQCTLAFRLTPEELSFYRMMNLPLPRLCSNCRHYERLKLRNPINLWHRQCMCNLTTHQHKGPCPTEFETSYAPDRPEIVYCEQCYNAEVV